MGKLKDRINGNEQGNFITKFWTRIPDQIHKGPSVRKRLVVKAKVLKSKPAAAVTNVFALRGGIHFLEWMGIRL